MSYLIVVMPGLSLACVTFLTLIGLNQLWIYRQTGYNRSWNIGMFCLLAAVFAGEPFVVQSRMLPIEFTHYYTIVSATCHCLASIYYLWALNFFLAIPDWVRRAVTLICGLFAFAALSSLFSYSLFGESLFFDVTSHQDTENYFVDSYSLFIGSPRVWGSMILAGSSLMNSLSALVILRIVLKSSRDVFFIIGLTLTVLASIIENFLLPFTFEVFVPVIFLSNLFEAFRMTNLAGREYHVERWLKAQAEGALSAEPTPEQTDGEGEKYQNSSLTSERLEELSRKVQQVFEQDRIYLNPNLNSEQVAKAIGIPSYQLSQVINIGLKTHFFDLLSSYRIEEMKRRLSDPKLSEETIINLAYQVGFNSKSSFNTSFKRATGLTPSDFRKQALGKNPS